jgi:hypothetical protein
LTNGLVNAKTFNEAQREVYKLISLDVYPKYIATEYQSIYMALAAGAESASTEEVDILVDGSVVL